MTASAGDDRALHPVPGGPDREQAVVVRPSPGGWRVESGAWSEPLMFLSGHAAETAAGRLAEAIAACGDGVRVEIYDRRYLLAGVRWVARTAGLADPLTSFPSAPA
jgi:hypothetical protein